MTNICGCMGPMYGEPFCYCKMVSCGFPLNREARDADNLQFKNAMTAYLEKERLKDAPETIDSAQSRQSDHQLHSDAVATKGK